VVETFSTEPDLCRKIRSTMTRTEIEQQLTTLNNLILEGKMMEAFETYYHDEVSMQENSFPPTVTKVANRQRELAFLADVTELRTIELKGLGIGDNLSFVIWKYDYTHKEWGRRDYTQVSIQEWRDGQIIKERFIYEG
jgi:hypothetical protein